MASPSFCCDVGGTMLQKSTGMLCNHDFAYTIKTGRHVGIVDDKMHCQALWQLEDDGCEAWYVKKEPTTYSLAARQSFE